MNPASIDLSALPSLPLKERHKLPKCPAVYFVIEGNRVFYIGRINNLHQRFLVHHRWNQLKVISGNIRISWLSCSVESALPEMEKALINYFQPYLNGSVVPSKQKLVMVESCKPTQARVNTQRRVVIPLEMRRKLGLEANTTLIARIEDGRLALEKRENFIVRLLSRFAQLSPTVSLADELITSRREAVRGSSQ